MFILIIVNNFMYRNAIAFEYANSLLLAESLRENFGEAGIYVEERITQQQLKELNKLKTIVVNYMGVNSESDEFTYIITKVAL